MPGSLELAPDVIVPLESPPTQPHWLPTEQDLLNRPVVKAYSIDPEDCVEVDDAVKTVHRSATEHRVAGFIADVGLIRGETEALDLARARGWTRYGHNKTDRTVTMFDESIYVPLGLDQRHHRIGAPAIGISFSINPQTGSWGEAEFSKVTLKATCYTYEEVDGLVAGGNRRLNKLVETGNVIAQALGNPNAISSSGNNSRELVARYMVMINFIAAEKMEQLGVPWLYRNHGLQAIEQIRHINDDDRALFRKFMRAVYHDNPSKHSGLGLGSYCHLTSGLRRFPDTANGLNLDSVIDGLEPVYSHEDMVAISDEMTEIYRKEMVRRSSKQRRRSQAEAA